MLGLGGGEKEGYPRDKCTGAWGHAVSPQVHGGGSGGGGHVSSG